MKKHIILMIIIVAFLLMLPLISNAASSGTCGDNVTWVLNDAGILTISGTGAMYDYDNWQNMSPWNNQRSSINNIVIEEGVTSIGSYAFYFCSNMQTIILPDSMSSIKATSVLGCPIQNIVLSDSNPYYSLIDGVLYDKSCSTLIKCPVNKTSVEIVDTVLSIEDYAFYQCNISSISIPQGLTSIGNQAFGHCNNLSAITLPDGLLTLGTDSFSYCYRLTEIHIPETITIIPCEAFVGCTGLQSVSIPESVTKIDSFAFSNCRGLTDR